jgi:hypothetical protein
VKTTGDVTHLRFNVTHGQTVEFQLGPASDLLVKLPDIAATLTPGEPFLAPPVGFPLLPLAAAPVASPTDNIAGQKRASALETEEPSGVKKKRAKASASSADNSQAGPTGSGPISSADSEPFIPAPSKKK